MNRAEMLQIAKFLIWELEDKNFRTKGSLIATFCRTHSLYANQAGHDKINEVLNKIDGLLPDSMRKGKK